MDIVFMGSPDFSLPVLEKLAESDVINIKGVVTQPDRKRGRGQKLRPTPVKKKALELGLKVYEEENVNRDQFIDQLKNLNLKAIVVVAFGQKLSNELLNIPEYGCINVHASLLPQYRGASPIHYAIVNGDNKTGVTIMYMEEELDTGDIISQKEVEINADDTVGDLHDKLAEVGADLLVNTLLEIESGTAARKKQDHSQATYAPKLERDFGKINWNKSACDIYNLVRGVNPWPGAYTYLKDKVLKIWQVEIISCEKRKNKKKAGKIIRADADKGLFVQCGKGIIAIKKLQLEGRKKMPTADFLRGYEVDQGLILGKGGL